MNNNDNFIEEGIKAFQYGNFRDVINIFSNIDTNSLDDETKKKVFICMCESYENLSDYFAALEYYRKLDEVAEKLNDSTLIFNSAYRSISVYCAIKDYENAEKFISKALDIAYRKNDPFLIAKAYNALGIICIDYTHKTNTLQNIGIRAFKRALSAIDEMNYLEFEAMIHSNLGFAYIYLLEFDKALEHLFIAYDFFKKFNNKIHFATVEFNIGKVYLAKNNYNNAKAYLDRSMRVFEEKNCRSSIAEAYGVYSELYEKLDMYKEALRYSRLHNDLILDIKNTDYIKIVSTFRMQYEVLKLQKDKEIYKIKNEQLRQLNAELKAAYEVVNTLSETDFLTSFYNRRGLECSLEELDKEIEHGVLILDIDHFKSINDNFGHHVGDEVLRNLAERIRRNVNKDECILVRFGGEEFIIILKNSSKEETFTFGKALLELIKKDEFVIEESKIKITATAGVDSFIGRKKEFNDCVRRADIKLYQGKLAGRDRIIV